MQRPFAGRHLPFVCADDLAVLKSLFYQAKDWVDIAAMSDAGSLDLDTVIERVATIVGGDDARVDRLRRGPNRCNHGVITVQSGFRVDEAP